MVDERALTIRVQEPDELDTVATGLFSRRYIQLTDAEASKVWDAIELASGEVHDD